MGVLLRTSVRGVRTYLPKHPKSLYIVIFSTNGTVGTRRRFYNVNLRQDANNAIMFMESNDYIRFDPDGMASAKDLYEVYCTWCIENSYHPLRQRSFSDYLSASAEKYGIEHTNNIYNTGGRRVRGYKGIRLLIWPGTPGLSGMRPVYDDDLPFK